MGSILILNDCWSDNALEYLLLNEIKPHCLTNSFGFKDRDISFILRLTFLKILEIYTWGTTGYKNIADLIQL